MTTHELVTEKKQEKFEKINLSIFEPPLHFLLNDK